MSTKEVFVDPELTKHIYAAIATNDSMLLRIFHLDNGRRSLTLHIRPVPPPFPYFLESV
jgi:hypothetical protein